MMYLNDNNMNNIQDVIGKSFTRWTVLEYIGKKRYEKIFLCKCECGNTSEIRLSRLKRGESKSCGCLRSENISKANSDRKGTKNKEKYEVLTCEACKKEFEKLKSNIKNSKFYYCSMGCRAKHQATYIVKENHPCYIVDRSSIIDRRKSEEGASWRLAVFKRDGYKCQCCRNHGKIHAHHLKSFTRFPELRYDIGNGVTLCEICHRGFHSVYGTRNFTSDDYYEFIKERGVKDGE